MKDITKKYSNDEITIVWKPNTCIHSTYCWKGEKGLRKVFNPSEKPWINAEAATALEIIERVNACPSGALSFYYNDSEKKPIEIVNENNVEVTPNGPLIVYGNIIIKDKDGNKTQNNNMTAFCRCGASSNKPYCDGTHSKVNFKD